MKVLIKADQFWFILDVASATQYTLANFLVKGVERVQSNKLFGQSILGMADDDIQLNFAAAPVRKPAAPKAAPKPASKPQGTPENKKRARPEVRNQKVLPYCLNIDLSQSDH